MPRSAPPEGTGFFDSLFEVLRQAFDDIRHKVVEEGWFGRQVTGDMPKPSEGLGWDIPQRSFDELWAPAERDANHDPASVERGGPDLDR